ncbi:Hypothetical predicted protein [Pelobates cultripes]|nr:Hypothetical predicted protein [Pelobates cultripes]
MGFFLKFLIIFPALAKVASSLQCVSCTGTGVTTCTGTSVTCPSGYFCASAYMMSNISGTSVVETIRSCQPAEKCNKMGIVANTALNIGFLVTCCSTDDCTPTIPTIPSISNAFNGLTCPSCISASSDCTSSETMLCQGEENMCVRYTTISNNGISNIRGCSTQAPCDIGSFTATASGAVVSISFLCNSGTTVFASQRQCVSCTTSSNTTCTGRSVICPTGYVCATSYLVTVISGKATIDVVRSCAPESKCNIVGSMTYSGVKIYMASSCCSTNNCSPTMPMLPPDNVQANGLVCPTCISPSSSCSSNTMQCTGSENMCVSQTKQTGGTIETISSCGTSTLCDVGTYSVIGGGLAVDFTFSCTNPVSSSLQCVSCITRGSTSCTGSSVACPSGYACASAYMLTLKTDGSKVLDLVRSCAPTNKCNVQGSMSYYGAEIFMQTTCCSSNYCSPSVPAEPVLNTRPNGYQCKTCSSLIDTSCNPSSALQCTGNENTCVQLRKQVTGGQEGKEAYYGCGTRILCDISSFYVSGGGVTVGLEFTCNSGETITRSGMKFTIAASLLLIKSFFVQW